MRLDRDEGECGERAKVKWAVAKREADEGGAVQHKSAERGDGMLKKGWLESGSEF